MPRPISATLSLSALSNNLQVIRRFAPRSKVWSVVKANAYGHGVEHVLKGLSATDGFGLLDFKEAVLLRESGWQGPILLLEGFFSPADLEAIDQYRLTTAVHSDWQIDAIKQAKPGAPINVYLKINSGMNRLGFMPEKVEAAWHALKALPQVGEITLMSHFAHADGPEGVEGQMTQILAAGENISGPRSLANSAATLWYPETHYDWVRPGIILYGASPSGKWRDIADSGLKPVMTLSTEIIATQQLRAGDRVGYSGRYRAASEQRIGIIACGYADGYPRHAPSGTPVWVDGVMTQTVGTVSMDMIMVDLTPCPQAAIGSKVELWGANLPVDDVATVAGTLGYELLSALAPRVPVRLVD
ncbi:catabolic alanine racemase DadX [Ewingella sp. AOP9-I1-14]